MKKIILLLSAATLALSGCVNTNSRTAQVDYADTYRQAYMALQKDEWLTYKNLMRIVIDKSTVSNAPAEKRSIYWYEYGRASGVVCDWEDAEFSLNISNYLDAQSGGPAYMSLNELGRISVARKQYDRAVDYFTRGLQGYAEYQGKISSKENKTHLIDSQILEEFAYALEQENGKPSEIKRLKENASEVRKKVAASSPANNDIAPYGTQCKTR